jgi:glycosyltransferase involved in cell wall biosynthesis
MKISVIIPTRDRLEQLAQCLDRVAPGKQTIDSGLYEVIVSDDGRTSPAAEALGAAYPFVRWVKGPARGPAANRNAGARVARGDLLVFTDDDCLPDPVWLEAYLKGSATVREGRTYPDRPRRSIVEECPINETGGNLWSCNFAIARSAFETLGGFDERFPHAAYEDMDFYLRCQKERWDVEFIAAAAVCHPFRPARDWNAVLKLRQSLFLFMDKYPDDTHFHRVSFWLRGIARDFVYSVPKEIWYYRGRGLWIMLGRAAFKAMMVWTLLTRSPPFAQGQGLVTDRRLPG